MQDIDGLSVSPDGAWAAYQLRRADPLRNRYEMAWYVVPTSGKGEPRRIADGGQPILVESRGAKVNGWMLAPAPVWSPDSKTLVYLRKEHGRTFLWSVGLEGQPATQLTEGSDDTLRAAFSPDGRTLIFETAPGREAAAALLREREPNGYLYDDRFSPGYAFVPLAPAGAVISMADGKAPPRNDRRLHVFDVHHGGTFASSFRDASPDERAQFESRDRPLQPPNRPLLRGAAVASRAGRLAWTEARDPSRQGALPPVTLVASGSKGKGAIVCTASACTTQTFRGIFWRSEEEVIFARVEDPLRRVTGIYSWRPGRAEPRLLARTTDRIFGQDFEWQCGMATQRLICLRETTARPRDLVAMDLDSGRVDTLVNPNPQFDDFDLGSAPRLIEIDIGPDMPTYGYLVLPPGHRTTARLPLVIVTYRCSGFLRGGQGNEYPVFPFAAQGLAVLCIDVPHPLAKRLETETWDENEIWSRGPGDPAKRDVQRALETAVARLASEGIIDPERVAITGLSFGAETVSYALFNMPSLAAAIASGTEIGPSSTFIYGTSWLDFARSSGLDSATSDRWRSLSLAWNAEKVRTPLLLNVPDHELVSNLEVYSALLQAGRSVEMFVHPDEYHIKWQPVHRLAIYQRNIDWLNFWLRGVEDGTDAKKGQYERWRKLRQNQCLLSAAFRYCRK